MDTVRPRTRRGLPVSEYMLYAYGQGMSRDSRPAKESDRRAAEQDRTDGVKRSRALKPHDIPSQRPDPRG